jgi:formylmethanofuran dehydrogenase subunit E
MSKPYPRRCAKCGEVKVVEAVIEYDGKVKRNGQLHSFSIPDLIVDQCSTCGEQFFTTETSDQIDRCTLKIARNEP